MADFRSGAVDANGIDFHYIEAGSGPLVLCLHGFPDNAYTYRYLLPVLADAGFRGVAPFMRGYAPTGKPADERYEAVLMAQDAAALIPALGADKAFLVGHDWGAAATYGCAVLAPERLNRIVTLAVTHGVQATDYESLKGTWHGYFFQMPYADQLVAANDYDFVYKWWRDASPDYEPPAEVMESVKATFRNPGVVTAALNYYRHTVNPANRDPALAPLREKLASSPIRVRTMIMHGTRDRPGRLGMFERMGAGFEAGLEKVLIPGTGHFLHLERPAEVNTKIVQFLKG
jgi:pimeloyl-ACP methyl ester carboxylesterase